MEEEILGTDNDDTLTGTEADERITGFAGDDTIEGGGGTDRSIHFGTHADYIITQNADGSWTLTDTEEADDNQGTDTLINIEQLTFTRTGTFTPEELLALQTTNDQTLTGTNEGEIISGSLGDDTIDGGAGRDFLYGGPGDDRITGGTGNDFINGGTGTDTIVYTGSFADYTLTANADQSLTITDTRTGAVSQGADTIFNVEQVEFASGETISIADWIAGETALNEIANIVGQTQFVNGTILRDAFVIDANSSDYLWAETLDGTGVVVWSGTDFDILTDIEQINFNDGVVTRDENGAFIFTPEDNGNNGETNLIADIAGETQFVNGTAGTDAFVIDANSTGYGWGTAADGQGIVVWTGADFDVLQNVEEIRFNNGTVTRAEDGTYNFTPTGTPETGQNLIADVAAENQTINGSERPDIFTINGVSTDYGWAETLDSEGVVVWNGPAFDILNNVEQLQFTNGVVTQLADDTFVFASNAEIQNLTGTAGANTLTGGNANDTLTGAGGDDQLTGGTGLDLFVASVDNGDDTILDFEDGYDLIDFTALTGTVDEFADLTITQAGANAVVTFDGGSFTVNGVQTDTLTFNDFIFA
mgnify:CR=1 FL=1